MLEVVRGCRRALRGITPRSILKLQSGIATTAKSHSKSAIVLDVEISLRQMDTQSDHSHLTAPGTPQSILFAVDFGDPGALAPTALGGSAGHSIVVRIEPEDVLFILGATEPEIATKTFAEALAKRTALSAVEKDLPSGVELPVSAKQIDRIPPEIENRLPDFYMNGNKAWLVGRGTAALVRSQETEVRSQKLPD